MMTTAAASDQKSSDDEAAKLQFKRRTHDEAFLSSMTFSSFKPGECCDCDECDAIALRQQQGPSRKGPVVSDTVLQTIQGQQQRQSSTTRRNQERTLRKRGQNQISVWKWAIPPGSDPLIEYGTSHRLIWVERLDEGHAICSIGNNGDSDATGPNMEWEEGKVYLVPSSEGKAVGWVNKVLADGEKEKQSGEIDLIIAKVPPSALDQVHNPDKSEEASEETWESALQRVCSTLLKSRQDHADELSIGVEDPQLVNLLKQSME